MSWNLSNEVCVLDKTRALLDAIGTLIGFWSYCSFWEIPGLRPKTSHFVSLVFNCPISAIFLFNTSIFVSVHVLD